MSRPSVATQRTGSSTLDDAPPPYTPSADFRSGESTLEFGPQRPFQRAPRSPHPQPFVPPQGPPPQLPVRRQRRSSFTEDFYAAGDGTFSRNTSQPQSPAPTPGPSSGVEATHYLPPAGTLPRNRSISTNFIQPPQTPDDGRPTTQPKPGHPLLNNGRILVYPADYLCYKCSNTGYKSSDPNHPCRRCWERYARPYVGAITYAPTSNAAGGSRSNTSFQRPLSAAGPPRTMPYTHSRSMTDVRRMPGGYPGQNASVASRVVPSSGSNGPQQSNAIFVHPGDPRAGGRLCWRCGGDGKTSFLIFDEQICPVCEGIGRTFL